MKALALVSTPAWWVKGRRKVRASPVLQTLLLLFMLLAMFGIRFSIHTAMSPARC